MPNLPLYSFAISYDEPSAHGFNYFKFKGPIVSTCQVMLLKTSSFINFTPHRVATVCHKTG